MDILGHQAISNDGSPRDNLQATNIAAIDTTGSFTLELDVMFSTPMASTNECNIVLGDIAGPHVQLFLANAQAGPFAGTMKMELYSEQFTPRIIARPTLVKDVQHTMGLWAADNSITLTWDGVVQGVSTPYFVSTGMEKVLQLAQDVITNPGKLKILAVRMNGNSW